MDDLKNIQFFNVYSNDLDESTYYDYDDDFYAIYEPFFICDCHGCIPFINGINNNFINISSICNNFEQEQHSIKEIFKIFVQPINSEKKFDKCKIHYRKFDYYCNNCKEHLCKICSQESSVHLDHNIVLFNNQIEEIRVLASNIKLTMDTTHIINPELKKLYYIIYDNFLKNERYYSYIRTFNSFRTFLNINFNIIY